MNPDRPRVPSVGVGIDDAEPSRGEARTARGALSRAALIRAARAVFERDGIGEVKPADIATAAGVSRATFYTYFADREEILNAVLANTLDRIPPEAALREHTTDQPNIRDHIESRHRAYLDSYAQNAKLMILLEQASQVYPAYRALRIRRAEDFVARNANWIRRLQREGRADPELDAELASTALSAMVSRLAHFHFGLGSVSADVEDLVEISTQVWLRTLEIRQ